MNNDNPGLVALLVILVIVLVIGATVVIYPLTESNKTAPTTLIVVPNSSTPAPLGS